jgi:uroporphyrinogen-III synthase
MSLQTNRFNRLSLVSSKPVKAFTAFVKLFSKVLKAFASIGNRKSYLCKQKGPQALNPQP